MVTRHEIPTHLGVEDRLLAGLTLPQLLVILVGGCVGYAAWQDVAFLPTGGRLALAGAALLAATAVALVRPHGQGLLTWALVILRYLALPRVCLWRPEAAPVAAETVRGMLPRVPVLAWAAGGGARSMARGARR